MTDADNAAACLKLHASVSTAFNQEPDAQTTPCNERERYSAAVIAVAEFFAQLGERDISRRFFYLGAALADLNHGSIHPLLRPITVDNRRADNSQAWAARAQIALGLEALMRTGRSLKQATAELRKGFPELAEIALTQSRSGRGTPARAGAPQEPLQTVIAGWRKGLRQARVKNDFAAGIFSVGMECIKRLSDDNPEQLADFAKRQLAEATAAFRVLSPQP
ncbi:MAG: hypothetical protein QOJ54_161 [Aliidongia sp.]|nr:hypothetical protein [Aliidongia sp.]